LIYGLGWVERAIATQYDPGAALHRKDIWLDSSPRIAQMSIVIDIVIGGA
jgi:hypothetical protein